MPKQLFFNSSFFLLCFLSLLLVVSSMAFVLGFDLSIYNVFLSFLFSILILSYVVRTTSLDVLLSVLLSLIIIFISYQAAIHYFDTSWDGQGYHQETIYLLKNGWNPIYEDSHSYRVWVNLYQKGNEIIQANVYLVSHKIEAGKLFNLLLVYIAFIVFYSFLETIKIQGIYRWLLSFIVVFNPIVFTQVFTYYIDGNWYLTLLISLTSLMVYFSQRQLQFLIIFILSSVVFCSLKFSSIPVFVVFSFFAIVYHYIGQKKVMIIPYFSILVLVLVSNIHPFITNVQRGNHLLHPFVGEKKIDIINQNIPELLLNKNRVERLMISLFSKTHNDFKKADLSDVLKFPFVFTKEEFFINYDTRLGGFGFLFSGVLVFVFILAFYLFLKKRQANKKKIVLLLAALLVSIMINPASWWPRLSAQIWLLPIVLIIFGLVSKKRILVLLSQITVGLLLVNILISGSITVIRLQQDNKIVHDFISTVGDKTITLDLTNPLGFQQYYLKFKERKIKYKLEKIRDKNKLAPFTPDVYYKIE